jgi:hypothetical protein
MMHDNLDPHVEPTAHTSGDRVERHDEALEQDREVPLNAQMPAIIHAWLDGEPVKQEELHAAGGFEFWRQVSAETDRRRRMRTPTPISGAIMEAIRKER